jgi:hypothetical protein
MELRNGWKLARDQYFESLKNGWKFVKEVGICLMILQNSWSYIMGQDPCGEQFFRYIIIWLRKFNIKKYVKELQNLGNEYIKTQQNEWDGLFWTPHAWIKPNERTLDKWL